MEAAAWIAVLWLLFGGSHVALSSLRLRPRLVAALGPQGFQAAYSLLALAVFTALVWFYLDHRHEGPLLWAPRLRTAGLWVLYVGQGVAWTLVAAGGLQPSPAMTGGMGQALPEQIEVRGAHRITRHGIFMGVGLMGLLHLPVNGFLSDVVFWSGFPVFALIGCWHQDRRKLATEGPGYRAWHEATPFLPFAGGQVGRALRELPPLAVALGIGLATGLRWLHGPLFY